MDRDREQELRRRVRRWRALEIDDRMAQPGFAYGCMADIAELLDQIDDLSRQLGHPDRTPTASTLPAIPAQGSATPATSMPIPALPPAGPDGVYIGWNAALAAGETRVAAAISRGMVAGMSAIDLRTQACIALRQLRNDSLRDRLSAPTSPTPAFLPPAEPPPFTA